MMRGIRSAASTIPLLAALLSSAAVVSAEEGTIRGLSLHVESLGDFPLAMNGRVETLQFSADGTKLYAVAEMVARFDWREHKLERYLWAPRDGHTMMSVQFSPDGRLFARLENGENIHIHDAENGKLIRTLAGRGTRSDASSWGPKSKLLACGGVGQIYIWNVASGELVNQIPQGKSALTGLDFSPDGGRIVVGNRAKAGVDDGRIFVHQLNGSAPPLKIGGLQEQRWSLNLRFSPDGSSIAGSDNHTQISVFDAKTGRARWRHLIGSNNFLCFSADGKMLATGSNNRLQVFDAESGDDLLRHENEHINVHWESAAFTPDGSVMAAAADNRIKFWNTKTWEQINPAENHGAPVHSLAFTPDGKQLVTGDLSGRVVLWDWDKKSPIWSWERPGSSWGIRSLSVSPDGRLIGVVSPEQKSEIRESYHLLDRKSGHYLRSFGGRFYRNGRLVFSPDSQTAYSGNGGGGIDEWDPQNGTLKRKIGNRIVKVGTRTESRGIHNVAFPPGGDEGIWWVGDYQGLGFRQLEDGTDLKTFKGGSHHAAAQLEVSPNNNWLIVDGRLWRLPDGKVLYRGSTSASVPYPHGRFFAGSRGNVVQIVDVLSRKPTREINFGPGRIEVLAFSPDGSTLVTGGEGGVRFVSLKNGGRFRLRQIQNVRFAPSPHHAEVTPAQLWDLMGGDDAWTAYEAGWELARRDEFLALLGEVLQPAVKPTQESTRHLRLLLRDANFDVRLTAARMLNDQGAVLSKEDQQALRKEDLNPLHYRTFRPQNPGEPPRLRSMPDLLPLSNRLRSSRAVLVLEQDGSAWAIEILKVLAKGYEKSPLTKEAVWALRRLEPRRSQLAFEAGIGAHSPCGS